MLVSYGDSYSHYVLTLNAINQDSVTIAGDSKVDHHSLCFVDGRTSVLNILLSWHAFLVQSMQSSLTMAYCNVCCFQSLAALSCCCDKSDVKRSQVQGDFTRATDKARMILSKSAHPCRTIRSSGMTTGAIMP
jgi:hypothetical protein